MFSTAAIAGVAVKSDPNFEEIGDTQHFSHLQTCTFSFSMTLLQYTHTSDI